MIKILQIFPLQKPYIWFLGRDRLLILVVSFLQIQA